VSWFFFLFFFLGGWCGYCPARYDPPAEIMIMSGGSTLSAPLVGVSPPHLYCLPDELSDCFPVTRKLYLNHDHSPWPSSQCPPPPRGCHAPTTTSPSSLPRKTRQKKYVSIYSRGMCSQSHPPFPLSPHSFFPVPPPLPPSLHPSSIPPNL
jgi:hypothetical protein